MAAADSRTRPWVTIALVALLFAGNSLNYVDRQVVALLKPTLQAVFHWGDRDFAHLGSAFQLAAAAALLAVGWFIDRLGVRIAYGVAVVVWSLAGIGHAFAETVNQFVAARVVLGIAETVSTPAGVKAATLYIVRERRNQALGVINAASNVGAIVTPLIIPPFAVAFGWKAAFIVTGGLGLVWLVAWWLGTRSLTPVSTMPERAPVAWGHLFRDRSTWVIVGAKFFSDAVWWFVLLWMPDFFARQFGFSQARLGAPVALIFALAAIGSLSAGQLTPALRRRGFDMNRSRKISMLLFSLVVLAMPLATLAQGPWMAAGLIGVGLFAHQGFSTNVFGMATEIVPARRVASVIALGGIAGNIAGMSIIEVAGWSLTNGFGYSPMFAYCGIAYLLGLGWVQLVMPVLRPAVDAD